MSAIVDESQSSTFNETLYQEYSPLYISTTYAAVYSLAFALATAAIVHAALYHSPSMWARWRRTRLDSEDVHAKLMRNYPEVPDLWYWIYTLVFVGISILVIEVLVLPLFVS